jgi:hypothetical protein
MDETLRRLQQELIQAIAASGQSSYARRLPAPRSIPLFESVRIQAQEYLDSHPCNPHALRLLSQVEECFLRYTEAAVQLERAMNCEGSRNKADLKRMAHLRSMATDWQELRLSPLQLRSLGQYLIENDAQDPTVGSTIALTVAWLAANSIPNQEEVIEALRYRGGSTDFMVLHNVVVG